MKETALKKELRLMGLTQLGAAKKCRVTEQTMSAICNGKKISPMLVNRLIELGVSIDVIKEPMKEV